MMNRSHAQLQPGIDDKCSICIILYTEMVSSDAYTAGHGLQ